MKIRALARRVLSAVLPASTGAAVVKEVLTGDTPADVARAVERHQQAKREEAQEARDRQLAEARAKALEAYVRRNGSYFPGDHDRRPRLGEARRAGGGIGSRWHSDSPALDDLDSRWHS